jgi:Uma2 family endonuclease
MSQTKLRFVTFDEYLAFDDGTDKLYELLHEELVELPPEPGENVGIANFLFLQFALILGHLRVRGHGLELEVRGEPKNRYPDLTVIREEHIEQLQRRNTLRLSMAPPLLVIEVVSPGEESQVRDYGEKRAQYQDRGIPEFWLIDPSQQRVTVLVLEGAIYKDLGVFKESDFIQSLGFSELALTATQVLSAGRSA